MYTLITVLIFIVCVLLVLIVLVQNSKGGGLASNFQSSNQIMGVRKTTDFLEKATWVLAGALLVLSIMGSAFIPRERISQEQSRVREQVENAPVPNQVPNFPTTAPEAEENTQAPAPSGEEDGQ
ncbi:preprotein translocase subunit SecG [Mariniphaga sediminis]|uniref:Protein-export membrane protein SecG n=1 Tax=Mariniphaga sediminis TaxID=1628158 RepID=A0A399CY36_9BACT|nr:preprotein translocase subunit SecG [Mariniphaga sediminis]RIH63868.1 preprotein translocase subunit SecG [Mariniphaga sediminis]